jgi:FAD/FMN-containing dehydrogenase/Fe-S oxidoreductase
MNPVAHVPSDPVPQARVEGVDLDRLRAELEAALSGEVRFDRVSRALYATDASVYQIVPSGVVVPASREDVIRTVEICARHRCPLTVRGGGTSQAGQAIGPGIQIDTSKHFNRLLEVNVAERWARVEPGLVLAELNAALRPHGLKFAPDISTHNRATLGGMMANNSSGARSVLYGKTIDHVLEQQVVLSDGSLARFHPLSAAELDAACTGTTLEAVCYRTVRDVARASADEIARRFPKVLRRVGGYNLDAFVDPARRFDLTKLIVGSEGTLGVIVEATVALVPLPAASAVLTIEFAELLDALEAAPSILKHAPSAIEVIDRFVLGHTRDHPDLDRLRRGWIDGDPGAVLTVELYGDRAGDLPGRLEALERDLSARGLGDRFTRALDAPSQARIWSVREAALGLSMAQKTDAKAISFVEDAAVPPDRLRDYIDRLFRLLSRHRTDAGVYAHASVGCLHVRPVINLKTEEGVRTFEAIAGEVADLVLEFGGALSGEHGDGLVRSPFMSRMFGPALYEAFRTIKRTFDPDGILNPGKIVDAPPITANLRYGPGYRTPAPDTFFDYAAFGGMGGAVDMCSGLGACRKTLDGTMCPSYMATREEEHSTRGRANVLRLAMAGRLEEARLGDEEVRRVMALCLECRACRAECPVGVDVARFKSEFLAAYWTRHDVPRRVKLLGHIDRLARWGSRLAPLSNVLAASAPVRWLNERLFELDSRRTPPRWARKTFARQFAAIAGRATPDVLLFNDTFTNYYDPGIGMAGARVLRSSGLEVGLAPNRCCGRPLISQGLLALARERAADNTDRLARFALNGQRLVFFEPSCLSAVREDAPALLRGDRQRRARDIAARSVLFEEFVEEQWQNGDGPGLRTGPAEILLHGHCHQKAMGLVPASRALLSRIPGARVVDLDAGCCGMAGSFGYIRDHFEVSRTIGERRLLPAVRRMPADAVVVAGGVSCRHQVADFTGARALHPAELLSSVLEART